MPYPFVVRDPEECNLYARRTDGAEPVPDRFNYGDLRVVRPWFTTLLSADIWVECNVQYLGTDTPSQRILAHRSGGFGFVAIQSAGHQVDIYTLPPLELGSAIAGSATLTKPGKHPKMLIPEYIPQVAESSVVDRVPTAFSIPVTVSAAIPRVAESEVTVYATVQSHWRPTREWGLDRTKDAAVWVRIKDDGDYLYAADYSHAKPMTARSLRESIDRLISADIVALKRFRTG